MNQVGLGSCFIVAPFGCDVSPLKAALDERGIIWFDLATSLPVRDSILETVRSAIETVAFVCGVLTSGESQQEVLFELGIAVGLKKPILLFADRDIDLPMVLTETFYVRTSLKNRNAVDFHLDAFQSNAKLRTFSNQSSLSQTGTTNQVSTLSTDGWPGALLAMWWTPPGWA
jgi:hypothetical protein